MARVGIFQADEVAWRVVVGPGAQVASSTVKSLRAEYHGSCWSGEDAPPCPVPVAESHHRGQLLQQPPGRALTDAVAPS